MSSSHELGLPAQLAISVTIRQVENVPYFLDSKDPNTSVFVACSFQDAVMHTAQKDLSSLVIFENRMLFEQEYPAGSDLRQIVSDKYMKFELVQQLHGRLSV